MALVFFLLLAPVALAGSQHPAPRQGVLLVADAKVADPRFHQAVVLLISHDMRYSAGLIINKPMGIAAGELPLDLPALSQSPVYYGGPVEHSRLHLLVRSDDPPEGSVRVTDEIHYLGSRARAENLDEHSEVRLYLGYAGWAPDQLAAEIARGDWHLVPGTADDVFSEDIDGLWSRLYADFAAVWI